MKKVPDPRSAREKKHECAEILTYLIMAYLCGRHSLRRAVKWAKNHLKELRRYMKLENGIASVATVHRLLRDIDQEEFANIFAQWVAQLLNQRKLVIAIDGKGLRGATDRIGNGKTPYILNVLDVNTMLVIAQLSISAKENEITGIHKLLEIVDINGNLITIDAIGTQWKIMEAIAGEGGFYLLTVKGNQPGVRDEILGHFRTADLRMEKGLTTAELEKYSRCQTVEKSRERIEHRKMEAIQANPIAGRDELAFDDIKTIGRHEQWRIKLSRDKEGNDTTPDLETFKAQTLAKLKEQKNKQTQYDDEYVCEGMIANMIMTAEEMASIKRNHWAVENSLHHVLDDLFREDRSPARVIKNNLSLIRKFCFNLLQIAIHHEYPENGTTEMMDDFSDNFELLTSYIFNGAECFN